ncbi:hypothetical protein, conserved [Eimeria brunetti]|uniref:Uncharacterized protein n=1 Tax=Eimeria brunetti TaxID=51314 RepID=U6LMZ6_9EIME|nr:hypothetical protein, conserved [Eimeria brunetti]
MQGSVGLPEAGTALLGGEPAAEGAGGAAVEKVGAEGEAGFEDNGEEGSEEYDDEDSLSISLSTDGPKHTLPIVLATSLLGAWIVLLVVAGISALRGGERKEVQAMPLDSDALVTYRERFRESVDNLEEAWKEVPEKVKLAFAKYHLPSASDDEQPNAAEAWTLMQKQIDGMNRTAAPPASASDEDKWKYAVQLHLVTAFCNSAALRLHGLAKLESKLHQIGMQVPWLCADEGPSPQPPSESPQPPSESPQLPSESPQPPSESPQPPSESPQPPSEEEAAEEKDEGMTFEDFANLLPPRVQQQLEDVIVPGTIPTPLGQRLGNLVEALDTFIVEGRYVAMRFDAVLDAHGVALEKVAEHDFENAAPIISPADKTPAAAKILLQFVAKQFESSTEKLFSLGVAKACAQRWGEESVKKVLKGVIEKEEQRMKDLVEAKRDLVQKAAIEKPLQKGHILALSVFVL